MASNYMFPNNPAKIRIKKYLAEIFADCTLLHQMYIVENFAELRDTQTLINACYNSCKFAVVELEKAFMIEIKRRQEQYFSNFNEEDYKQFRVLMQTFEFYFQKIFDAVQTCLEKDRYISVAEKKDFFAVLCDKLGISADSEFIFKLTLDALAETQNGNNEHVEYFDSLKESWGKNFPKYQYCSEIEDYIQQEKTACIVTFGNKIASVRNENVLIDLLVSVNIKLALSSGAMNPKELRTFLNKKFEKMAPQGELLKTFEARLEKIMRYYSLNVAKNYSTNIRTEFIPYRTALIYVDEILTEEIFYRYKNIIPPVRTESDREIEKKYELIISQKDAEIFDLKRDLEYYENIKAQEFRSDFSKYDEALTKLFQRLCEYKFGAPPNELYLLANSETDIKAENLKTILKNFLFVFNSLGITPFETKNLGKKLIFDSEASNVVYAVNEKDIVEGANSGTLKYPGWKYGEKKIVLPLILIDKEEIK